MKGKLRKGLLTLAAGIMTAVMLNSTAFAATETKWDVSKSKTAEALDKNDETQVTLSLPSEEEELVSDVVFALDTSSCGEEVALNAASMLADLQKSIESSNAKINVGIVVFRGNAKTVYPLTEYTGSAGQNAEIIKSFTTEPGDLYKGSNMPSGLLAAQNMLKSDTKVSNGRKYMVLISDGQTYVYTKDRDPASHYSRTTGRESMDGSLYEWTAKYPSSSGAFILPPALTNGGDSSDWEKFFTDIEQRHDDYTKYDQVYDRGTGNNPKALAGLTVPTDITDYDSFIINCEESMYQSETAYKEMAGSGINCYTVSSSADHGAFTSFMNYMGGLGKGSGTDFSNIKKDIFYLLNSGEVYDEMGSDFDFINEISRISITVGGEKLKTTRIDQDTYKFGNDENDDMFELVYTQKTDSFVWKIKVPVTNFEPVRLTYSIKLSKKETKSGTYTVPANNQAYLIPKDSDGKEGNKEYFEVPTVTYKVPISKVTVTYDPDGGKLASGESGKRTGKAGDGMSAPADPVRDGYTFGGWYTEKDGKGSKAPSSIPDKNTTYYAKWTPVKSDIKVTVTYYPDGGNLASGESGKRTGKSGDGLIVPADPTRDGYIFEGWYTEKDGKGTKAPSVMPDSDTTYYAKWTAITHGKKASDAPDTGDYSNTGIYVTVAIAAAASLTFLVIRLRKKNS